MFESTVSVSRNHIEDDKIGVFKPMFAQMGRLARMHPEELVFGLLKAGFATNCYDGQFFFDTDHVVIAPRERHSHDSQQPAGRGRCGVVSPGHVAGDQAADPGRERLPYTFESQTRPEDDSVFSNNNFVYGVRGAG